MIALAAIVLGLAIGVACGGSIRGLNAVSLRFEWPVLLLFAVQALARGRVAGTRASSLGIVVWVLSCVVLLVFLAPDWLRIGVWVAGMGIALNVFVVLLNGGMPVVLASQTVANETAVSVARGAGFYQLAGPGTLMGVLGDVLSLTIGGYHILVSPGDVLLALGVAVFIVVPMVDRNEATATTASEA